MRALNRSPNYAKASASPKMFRLIFISFGVGVPLFLGALLQGLLSKHFQFLAVHPTIGRMSLALLIMPFWWLLLVRPDWAARRRTLLAWSHIAAQWAGLGLSFPLAGVCARLIDPDPAPSEKLVCILILLLLPVSVYLLGSMWLYIARHFATRDEMMQVTQVWTRFDCWLFDKIVGKEEGH